MFLSRLKWVLVVDLKHELDWPGFRITDNAGVALSQEFKHVIYRPSHVGAVNGIMEGVYQQGGWNIFVDEVYAISNRGNVTSYPPAYLALLTRGRSRGITVWSGMQRPRLVPGFVFTEGTHFYVFRVADAMDRKRIAEFTLAEMRDFWPERYAFAYYNRLEHEIVYSTPLRGDLI